MDNNLMSPDGQFKVEFGALSEIAMGGPMGGECFLLFKGHKIKLSDWCGGPVV